MTTILTNHLSPTTSTNLTPPSTSPGSSSRPSFQSRLSVAGRHPHTHGPHSASSHGGSSRYGGEEEENPDEWLDAEGEEGVDFKQRIADLTHHAHNHNHLSHHHSDMDGFDELDFEDDEEAMTPEMNELKLSSSADSKAGTSSTSPTTDGWSGDEIRARTRQFSTVVWDWQDGDESGESGTNSENTTARNTPKAGPFNSSSSSQQFQFQSASQQQQLHHAGSPSLASTIVNSNSSDGASRSSSLSSVSSTGTTPDHHSHSNGVASPSTASTSTTTNPMVISAVTSSSSSSTSAVQKTHQAFNSHSNQTQHHHHTSSGAGIGRNLSLDSSARALGLNIVYVERLALPLLRSEIHSFFHKLLLRIDALLSKLESQPVAVLQRMLIGMERNAQATSDEELRRNFESSAKRLNDQIDEIKRLDPTPPSSATPTLSSSPPSSSSSSSPMPIPSSLSCSPPATKSTGGGGLTTPLSSPLAVSTSPSPSPSPSKYTAGSFIIPEWWPASLQASHTSLARIRDIFHSLEAGFDDASSTTIFGHGHTSTTTGSPQKHSATPAVLMSPPSLRGPTTSSSSRTTGTPLPKLVALPTTRSNRDGLKLLARVMQAFSLLVAFEGGEIVHASKLALAFQRMANTLLEKHHLEEPQWSNKS